MPDTSHVQMSQGDLDCGARQIPPQQAGTGTGRPAGVHRVRPALLCRGPYWGSGIVQTKLRSWFLVKCFRSSWNRPLLHLRLPPTRSIRS